MFGPEAPFEASTVLCFPAAKPSADEDTIHLYYGAGDSCMATATGSVRRLLSWLDANYSTGDETGSY
jgi:predicted GH43/DUF377 family glycosyl hydrolase